MYKIRIAVIVLFTFLLLCGVSIGAEKQLQKQTSIQKTLIKLLAENEVPGMNMSIIYKNGEIENYFSGFADVKNRKPLTPDHVMFSGSVGKTYAAAILLQLVDEGKVKLDDKFITYFPHLSWLKNISNIQFISVEMLLKHTSGLSRYIENQAVWDTLYDNPDKIWTYYDRLSHVFYKEAQHEAGMSWAYSDTNYILLGMLIEQVCMSNYYEEVKKRILIPYNLHKTYAAIKRDIPDLPIGYSKLDDFFRMPDIVVNEGIYAFNPQMEWTGGGIASTTEELARWAEIYYKGKMFSNELLRKMTIPSKESIGISPDWDYGMGSFIYNSKHGKIYGHSGFVPGFNSIIVYYPKDKITIALQINCDYAKSKMSLVNYIEKIYESIR